MPKIRMCENDAVGELQRLLKWNPRITLACAKEKTGWTGEMVEGLVGRHTDKFGILRIRGYTFIATKEEHAKATARSGHPPRGVRAKKDER